VVALQTRRSIESKSNEHHIGIAASELHVGIAVGIRGNEKLEAIEL
jgi:hypothetical protein